MERILNSHEIEVSLTLFAPCGTNSLKAMSGKREKTHHLRLITFLRLNKLE